MQSSLRVFRWSQESIPLSWKECLHSLQGPKRTDGSFNQHLSEYQLRGPTMRALISSITFKTIRKLENRNGELVGIRNFKNSGPYEVERDRPTDRHQSRPAPAQVYDRRGPTCLRTEVPCYRKHEVLLSKTPPHQARQSPRAPTWEGCAPEMLILPEQHEPNLCQRWQPLL